MPPPVTPSNSLFQEYLDYQYDGSYYSAGQFRPGFGEQGGLPIAGSDIRAREQNGMDGADPNQKIPEEISQSEWMFSRNGHY